ncbi:hypothetical protein ABZP36_016460 [Zizania latifolia]
MYLTGPMGMSTAAAAAAANVWGGTVLVLTLVGALAGDSRLGRCRAVVAAGVLYLLVSAVLSPLALVLTPTSNLSSAFSLILTMLVSVNYYPLFRERLYFIATQSFSWNLGLKI